MKVAVALCTLGGFMSAGALYVTGHWIAGTAIVCASARLMSTQAPEETHKEEE